LKIFTKKKPLLSSSIFQKNLRLMEAKRFRYPGVQPFQTSDRHIFFGRDEDRDKLYQLILLEKMLVLFGKSGYGKSSLLNAAIIPLLTDPEKRVQFVPLEIKFGNYAPGRSAPLKCMLERLGAALPDTQNGAFLQDEPGSDSLWHFFKRKQGDRPLRIVLFFDQFEEFFTYPAEQQQEFRWQLAELLFTDIPQALRDRFETLAPTHQDFLSETLHVKTVFAIRSDRMSLLDSMKDALPTILHKRYELRPLTRQQAEQAIVQPALAGHDEKESWRDRYDSPPFEYQQEAINAMLAPLMKTEGMEAGQAGVEAFLLQILCEYVEDLVKKGKVPDPEKSGQALDGNGLPDITPAQLPDMNNLLEDYVHRKLDELDPARCPAACRLLEEGLLAEDAGEGRRTSVDGKTLLGQFRQQGLTQPVLDDLEKTYLVRREPNTVGGFSYELSHDRLVAPVMKMKGERKEKEEKIAAAKRMRRLAGLFALAVVVAAGAVGFALWAFRQKREADEAKQQTQVALQKADKLIDAFYFYAGRFALAYGEKEYENVFYFIDKNGDEVAKLGRWEKAEQFERMGFSRVTKKEGGQFTDYLLDTLGNIYPAAFDVRDLNKNTTALDLSDKGLDRLPTSIFQHTQLKVLLLNGNQLTSLPTEIGLLKSLTSLDLGRNQLTSLPREIGQLKNLTSLDLGYGKNLSSLVSSGNQLTTLPREIGQLKSLTSLNLSGNRLTDLPREIGELKSLTSLSLLLNQLTSLPRDIGQLKRLTSLHLANNRLTSLPREIGQLKSLKYLFLGFNQLTGLPGEIGQLESLNYLFLDDNQLTGLPGEIGQLKNLDYLSVSNNRLTSLPREISQLKNLTSLDLRFNQLTSLPEEIWQLKSLTSLDLRFNQLTSLPEEIWQLKSLTSLDLGGNQLAVLPEEIWQLKNLTSLYLSGNQLTNLPGEIWKLKSLTMLDLSGNQLTSLPEEIGKLKSLTELDLGDNQLTSLPREIGQLESLTSLNLSGSQLTSLPSEIEQLKSLTELDLSENDSLNLFFVAFSNFVKPISLTTYEYASNYDEDKLLIKISKKSDFPSEIVQLKSLTSLDLNENQLTGLPPEIEQLKSLTNLSLGENQLTSLPPEIGQLKSLTNLSLGENQLTSLPPEIGQLKSLITLDLNKNKLSSLPLEIGQLKNLTSLNLNGNPIPEAEREKIRKLLPKCKIQF
jgi:Leucine-rich repeat (LRR) protein